MGVRECARNNSAFMLLKSVYEHREKAAREWREKGGKVVGILGSDVPVEILIAANMLPVQVYAVPGQSTTEAERYLEMSFQTTSKLIFQKLVDGTYHEMMDDLVISNSADQYVRLYLYLRELRRVEPEIPIPSLEFIDWLFTQKLIYEQWNEGVVKKFWKGAETWASRPITEEDCRHGIRICNENRAALREFCSLRRGKQIRVTGTEALIVLGSSLFMSREEHTAIVKEMLKEAVNWPEVSGKRVFVSGSDQDHSDVYEKIEAEGAVIVGEDHTWGERICQCDVNESYNPVRAIVERYMLRPSNIQKSTTHERVKDLNRSVTDTRAQAVIFLSQKYEDAISWDYPEQKKALDAMGIPSIKLNRLEYPYETDAEFLCRIPEFLQGGES
ncbi:MAG: 2-hydroxyacyl-CoA dehydratase family protein [Clostridiales bacterium]|nr:2-hydroxyacyl-CoA dehydratase family protein [Clostridiales bacterium]